jgi:hypothetical protein
MLTRPAVDLFERRYFEAEILQDRKSRKLYAPLLIAVAMCRECNYPIVSAVKEYLLKGLFHPGFGIEAQMRRAGWRLRHRDTNLCQQCAERGRGFTCALCGMERPQDQAAHTFGPPGWLDRICRSCDETQPGLLLQRKINELRAKHERIEADDEEGEDEAAESDMG